MVLAAAACHPARHRACNGTGVEAAAAARARPAQWPQRVSPGETRGTQGAAPEHAQRRLRARGGADLRRDRGVAQHARGLVVVARGRRHVDAQQQLAPAVQHIAEQVRHLPRPGARGEAG